MPICGSLTHVEATFHIGADALEKHLLAADTKIGPRFEKKLMRSFPMSNCGLEVTSQNK
jgi:hypothetical protein